MVKLLYEDETFSIRGAIFEVYKEMGPGFLESVYQECLSKEFMIRQIPFSEQQEICIHYKGEKLKQKYKPDFVCFGKIIIEIKAVSTLLPEHKAQIINYLKAVDLKLGLLINFSHYPDVQIERMVL